jgi:hypothetical protein
MWTTRPTAGGLLAVFHITHHSRNVLFASVWFGSCGSVASPFIALYVR